MRRTAEAVVLHRWTARQLRPVIVAGVALVFLAFAALAHFVFHSPEAVKALGMACLGSLGGLFASIVVKFDYELNESGLRKGPHRKTKQPDFKSVFTWDELVRIVPTRHGFKYYRSIPHGSALSRFWNKWISDKYSG